MCIILRIVFYTPSNAAPNGLPNARTLQRALRAAFCDLGHGKAVQPVQDVIELPGGGDVITFRAAVGDPGYLGVKLSPYLPQSDCTAVVTAWTVLLSCPREYLW